MKWIDSINFSNAKLDSIQAKLFDFAFIELFWKKSSYVSGVTGHFRDIIPIKIETCSSWQITMIMNYYDGTKPMFLFYYWILFFWLLWKTFAYKKLHVKYFLQFIHRLWCKYDMTRNGHTLEYMDFLKRLGVNAKPKSQIKKAGRSASVVSLCECHSFP